MTFSHTIKCLFGLHRWRGTPLVEVRVSLALYAFRQCRWCGKEQIRMEGYGWQSPDGFDCKLVAQLRGCLE